MTCSRKRGHQSRWDGVVYKVFFCFSFLFLAFPGAKEGRNSFRFLYRRNTHTHTHSFRHTHTPPPCCLLLLTHSLLSLIVCCVCCCCCCLITASANNAIVIRIYISLALLKLLRTLTLTIC